ncbi:MAG: DUF6789 family protein [Isosphaeraceae bacterium]
MATNAENREPEGEPEPKPDTGPGSLSAPGPAPSSGPRSFVQLVLGGFAGTVALAFIMFRLEPIFISRGPDPFRAIGVEVSRPRGLGLILFHFFNGSIVFPIGFGFFAGWLRIPWIAKGLIWGIILWLLAGLIVMPISGYGLFGYEVDGLKVAASSLLAHLAYGAFQGLVAAIPPREPD